MNFIILYELQFQMTLAKIVTQGVKSSQLVSLVIFCKLDFSNIFDLFGKDLQILWRSLMGIMNTYNNNW